MSSNRTYGPDCGQVLSETPCWRNNSQVAHDPEMNSNPTIALLRLRRPAASIVERSHRLRQTTGATIVPRLRGSECRATDAPRMRVR
jgi:hypothetical protein